MIVQQRLGWQTHDSGGRGVTDWNNGIMEFGGGNSLGRPSRLCMCFMFAMVSRTMPSAGGAWICAQLLFYVIICILLLLLLLLLLCTRLPLRFDEFAIFLLLIPWLRIMRNTL